LDRLQKYVEMGLLTVHKVQMKDVPSNAFHDYSLSHCLRNYGPSTMWSFSYDLDEYMVIKPSLYRPTLPIIHSQDSDAPAEFPLHRLLDEDRYRNSRGLQLYRHVFLNVGRERLESGEAVTQAHVYREANWPRIQTGGQKCLLRPAYRTDLASFEGPHACRSSDVVTFDGSSPQLIQDISGLELRRGPGRDNITGIVLPAEPVVLHHYIQRDVADCEMKVDQASTQDANNWRVQLGKPWCRSDRVFLERGTQLRMDIDFIEDRTLADSWLGRATAVVIRDRSWQARRQSDVSDRFLDVIF